ncbi:hypothetical protein ACYULU_16325 [Breznakiellaceae bacterium SP9]
MASNAIDGLGWVVKLLLVIFFDGLLFGGIWRILRGNILGGLLWIVTGGVFGIGWFVDIITMFTHKDIVLLA